MANDKPYQLPLPRARGRAAEFYAFCKNHELRFQRCSDCGAWRHVPRDMCAKCGSLKWEWARSSGRGKLFSWTTATQPMMPQFAESVPYSPAIVELEEGVRMVTWIVGLKPEELQLDMPVKVVFDDVTPEVTLPKFERA
ncbi:MAG TPA: OB-fold domain-containing protein [Candidatus Binataceae bacterium]|nr:OB-fold domain-containing protein [Candidatus Binataceae bacterium]